MNVGKIVCSIIGSGTFLFAGLYINHVYHLSGSDFIILLVSMAILAVVSFIEGLSFTNIRE